MNLPNNERQRPLSPFMRLFCAYYYCRLTAYDLPAGIAIFLGILSLILLLIAWKLNAIWLDRYQYLDCREVSCALVKDKEYKYIRYWDEKGRRICRSLLDMHLGRHTPDDEMEYTIRHVFIAGMASGDEYSNDLLKKIKYLQEKLDESETSKKKLQDHIDTVVKRKVESHEDTILQENAQYKKRIALLSTEKNDLTKSLKESKKAIQEANTARQEAEKHCEQLQHELEHSQSWIDRLNADLTKLQQQVSGNEYLTDLQDENGILKSELNQREQLLAFREEEVCQLKQQLDNAFARIELLEEERDDIKHSNQSNPDHLAPVQTLPVRPGTNAGKGGRPPKLSQQQLDELLASRSMGASIGELAKKYGLAKSTVSRICESAGVTVGKNVI